ncbi:MAG: SH3 domain-containing protein [Defluviitaleaceae bacterium]|nr:SH3 domain-containing protein [Defluviitaleaceae bacterium]
MKFFGKRFKASCRFAALSAVFSALLSVSVAALEQGFINAEAGAPLRMGPHYRAQVLGRAQEHQAVSIHSRHGDYYMVHSGDLTYVFVLTRFVTYGNAPGTAHTPPDTASSTTPDEASNAELASYGQAVAVIPNINIRSGNSSSSNILGTASVGDTFTILARVGDWYRISYNSQTAYIFSEFLSTTAYVPEAPQVAAPLPLLADPVPAADTDTIPLDFAALFASLNIADDIADDIANDVSNEEDEPSAEQPISLPPQEVTPPATLDEASPDGALDLSDLIFSILNQDAGGAAAGAGTEQVQASVSHAVVSSATGLNLRTASSTEAEVIKILHPWQTLNVYEVLYEWVRVSTLDGAAGYVSYEFVTIRAGSRTAPPEHNAERAQEIIDFARQFIGTPYAFGGTNLMSGVDCSGFVFSVMNEFDINLGRSSRDMINNGIPIDREDIAPGDLLFFSANGTVVTHVALYIGSDQFIHSTDTRGLGVSFASLTSDHSQRTYFGARRVILD